MSIAGITFSIIDEIAQTPKYYDFKVISVSKVDKLWNILVDRAQTYIDGDYGAVVLDESFEGASAWWSTPAKGYADVLTVIPEDDLIVLRNVTSTPPSEGGFLRLYPPLFLESLKHSWLDIEWAKLAFEHIEKISKPVEVEHNNLSGHTFRWLRFGQRKALKLVRYSHSYLWGPPGTGKTTTLAVLLAEYLYVNPQSRILLISTTNHAVDQALVSTDKVLDESQRHKVRSSLKRVGSRFIAAHYVGREHLIPIIDQSLIARLAEAEANRPDPSITDAYSTWTEYVEGLRSQIKAHTVRVLLESRLVAMTATKAIMTLNELKTVPLYDLIIFDEASQVSLAHALILLPLGKSVLFAGDPRQLAPIVRSKRKETIKWLGRSPFDLKPYKSDNASFLDEQSRMAEPICSLVSNVFYNKNLRVAKKETCDESWLAERRIQIGNWGENEHLCINEINSDGIWSKKYGGPIRYESVVAIVELIKKEPLRHSDIIIITPFRAQRALIKNMLSTSGINRVKVSTVHRSQGSESQIVIFDPVQGANPFLQTEDARKLINVALSRAKAKVILFLSSGDRTNPLLLKISNIIEQSREKNDAISISNFINKEDFPQCLFGKMVSIKLHTGIVEGVTRKDNNDYLKIINSETGDEQFFLLEHLIQNNRIS
jgi:DNA replication ATP-dependent helicase Dna2